VVPPRAPSRIARARGYLALLHPLPVVLVVVAMALFATVAARGAPPLDRLLGLLLSVLLCQVAIASLNDYCDRALDAQTKPSKPIPAGLVPAGAALGIALVATPLTLVAAAPLGAVALLAAAAHLAGGLAYDLWQKGTPWSAAPFVVAFPALPIWAWSAVAPFDPRLLEAYLIGAPLVVGLHLADTWPDVEADRAQGLRGLAHVLGPARARWLLWGAFASAPLLLVALAASPGRHTPVLLVTAGAAAALVGLALAISQGGAVRWPVAFVLLACTAIVVGVGWLAALVA